MKNPTRKLKAAGWKSNSEGLWIMPGSSMAEHVPLEEAINIYKVWAAWKKS